MAKVHISTLTNEELKQLITNSITKRGLSKTMVKLLLETYSLVLMIDKGWIASEHKKEAKEIATRNIIHVTDEYVIKPKRAK